MDNFDEILNLQKESKKLVDRMNVDYLFDEDLLVCDYVLDQLVDMDISKINYGKRISLEKMMEKSLDEMRMFGIDIENKTHDLLFKTSIECVPNKIGQFGTAVSYAFDNNDFVIPNSGVVSKYIVPSKLYELSIYHLAHEHIHAMKDTNYNEYKNCITLGEIIPLFYELMIYNPQEVLKNELLKFRMYWLLNNKNEYYFLNCLYQEALINECIYDFGIDKKTDVYMFMLSKIGCYLNSFYYAVMLYNMYKETPKKILDLVSKVLKHEITTLKMLEMLGIYGDIRGCVFEKEMEKIRKSLKKI